MSIARQARTHSEHIRGINSKPEPEPDHSRPRGIDDDKNISDT